MSGFRDGSARQSGLTVQPGDYGHERALFPVLGIVLDVYRSDDAGRNTSARRAQDQLGSRLEADVLVVQSGTDTPFKVQNVVIPPLGPSGYDDYSEAAPRPVSGVLDLTDLPSNLEDVPAEFLDGDWCVVHFIGGSLQMPVMLSWFPHPSNRVDAARGDQERRMVRRFAGTRTAVTRDGSVLLDTTEAGRALEGTQAQVTGVGGDVRIALKETAALDISYQPVQDTDMLPGALETPQDGANYSALHMDRQRIDVTGDAALALSARSGSVVVAAGETIRLGGESANDPLVLGNPLVDFLSGLLDLLAIHAHPAPFGSPPIQASEFQARKSQLQSLLSQIAFTMQNS